MAMLEKNQLNHIRAGLDSREDYCGLELYLSPEKGEDTEITADLISEEVGKYGQVEDVFVFHQDQDLRTQGRRTSEGAPQLYESFHNQSRPAEARQEQAWNDKDQYSSYIFSIVDLRRERRTHASRLRP